MEGMEGAEMTERLDSPKFCGNTSSKDFHLQFLNINDEVDEYFIAPLSSPLRFTRQCCVLDCEMSS